MTRSMTTADPIPMFAAAERLRSAARWRTMYAESLEARDLRRAAVALNQLGQAICVARDDIYSNVVVEEEHLRAFEALARTSSADDVAEAGYTLFGGRLFAEAERVFRLLPTEVVAAHPDFSGLYRSGAAMSPEARAVFLRLGILDG